MKTETSNTPYDKNQRWGVAAASQRCPRIALLETRKKQGSLGKSMALSIS